MFVCASGGTLGVSPAYILRLATLAIAMLVALITPAAAEEIRAVLAFIKSTWPAQEREYQAEMGRRERNESRLRQRDQGRKRAVPSYRIKVEPPSRHTHS